MYASIRLFHVLVCHQIERSDRFIFFNGIADFDLHERK